MRYLITKDVKGRYCVCVEGKGYIRAHKAGSLYSSDLNDFTGSYGYTKGQTSFDELIKWLYANLNEYPCVSIVDVQTSFKDEHPELFI